LLDNCWFVRVVLVLWLVSTVFVVLLLGKVDWVVHHELYNYGLQFSMEWASVYWANLRMIYVFLGIPICFSGLYFVLDVWRFISMRRGGVAVEQKPSVPVRPAQRVRQEAKAVEQNHMLISCPKCKKVFSKPLVMLDFSTGKSRLVNVCPYCNFVLSWGESSEHDVGVLDFEKRKVKEQ